MYCLNTAELVSKQSLCFALRIVVFLSVFCKFFERLWSRYLSVLNIYSKEEKYINFHMEPPKNHDLVQFHPSVHRTEDHGPDPQILKMDSSGLASVSLKPPEIAFSDAKPVHNYSIQTGEEFALEFMRDRFNPKKIIPDNSADASQTPGYLELKGILGIAHTGSETGSDISMIAAAEKESREFLQKNSAVHVDKGNNGSFQSMQSVPRASSDFNSHHTLMYTSSGASDSSSTKLKILCSFGGRILPRPSDGKLRYVGGDTRIVRINKDITWNKLWQKTTAIYEETCAIKYQLPGEDLDALVSISSDEDLLNMMEECNILEDGEGSKKLRMFLFSLGDLDDAHFSLTNNDVDSEMKYVVAVNGIDFGSRKSIASTSGNNLNELDMQNVNRDTSGIITEPVGISNSNLAGFIVPPIATEPSSSVLPISSEVYETDLRFYHDQSMNHDQKRQYPPQFGYNFQPPYFTPSEIALPPQTSFVPVSVQKGLEEVYLNSSGVLRKDTQEKDAKPKVDGLIQPESEKMQIYANEHFVPSQAHIDNTKVIFHVEEPPAMVPKMERELSSKDSKGNVRPDEPLLVSKPPDAVTPSSGNECFSSVNTPVPEPINLESDPSDLSYFESSLPPQRPFRSVWIPREQGELLSRISKSDDSHNSQFLVNQPLTDNYSQQDFVTESVEELQKVNVNIPPEQSISTEKSFPQEPETVDNGFKTEPEPEPELKLPAVSLEDTVNQSEDSTNDAHTYPQPSAWTGNQEESSVGVPTTKQGDILIDINDRFPRDLLSDIFSKAVLSDSSSDFGPLQKDGPGLSVNIENHDPKHWSFFQRLAGDEFTRRDVSLIDQDQVVFPSGLNKVEEEAPLAYDFVPRTRDETLPSELHCRGGAVSTVVHADYDASQVKVSEGMQYDDLVDNVRNRDSEYEDGFGNPALPAVDPLLLDIDLTSLQIIKNADLEELRELGAGTFGTVYHGKWRGSDVAIKRIKKSCFTGRQSEQERLTMEFWREAEILSKLHHPNVVAFYGVVQDGPGGTLATVTEFMVDGSLRHVLLRKDRHLDRRKRLIIAMDAAFGMEYLHAKNIVHFDLKCDNLLVNLKDPSRPICKVGDFGLSKIKRNTLVSGGVRGTLPWMAPELLNGSSNKVSEKVDVFSFGIVLWEILTGEEPYANMHYGAIIGGIVNNTLRPTIPSYCDAEWRGLMEQCWAPNPTLRPSFTEIASRLRVMSASSQTRKVAS
ncbi:dual specificity protein kinase shka [Phtheirospermum japonicum]|uniref:Dual specificity protein kinase shka n=1 Tax=Phtheirospermum japonicum TaxID=374723 RepID=A0A830CPG7_9LAMI|nr:dual specificity protein kinase shka [Phtheirospermum japonicum]